MGSFEGHALPGSLFIIMGIWWLVYAVLDYTASFKNPRRHHAKARSSNYIRSWRQPSSKRLKNVPIEPIFKVFGGTLGIVCELWEVKFHMVNDNNKFARPNKFAHSTMYSFFAFSGLVELLNYYKVTHFSCATEYGLLALSFTIEGMLFTFHLHGRDEFDVRIHTMLYIVIYATAIVTLLEGCLPRFQRELFTMRTVFVLTQGTWFWEIAYTIYGRNRWLIKDITKKELMVDTEVITFTIMWHLLAWISFFLLCCVLVSCLNKCGRLPACCLHNGSKAAAGIPNGRLSNSVAVPSSSSDEEEEEILLERNSKENDNTTTSKLLGNHNYEDA